MSLQSLLHLFNWKNFRKVYLPNELHNYTFPQKDIHTIKAACFAQVFYRHMAAIHLDDQTFSMGM